MASERTWSYSAVIFSTGDCSSAAHAEQSARRHTMMRVFMLFMGALPVESPGASKQASPWEASFLPVAREPSFPGNATGGGPKLNCRCSTIGFIKSVMPFPYHDQL